jgi:integrase
VNDLLDALGRDYELNGWRSVDTLRGRLDPLRTAFGTTRAVDVTGEFIEEYKAHRLAAKTKRGSLVAPATLNRELAALKRAFKLGIEQERTSRAPTIKLLAEHNARQGFVDPGMFADIVKRLPAPLDDVARFAYATAWRKDEVLSLEWSDVDLDQRRVTLRREESKNEEPRVVIVTGDLLALMQRRWEARTYKTRAGSALSRYVFHTRGQRIVDFRKCWAKACEAAGIAGLLFHDLRRSAVRNMDKAGVSESVAMRISGHKTNSVYRRYRIVDEQDIEHALVSTEAAVKQAPLGMVKTLRG